MAGQNKTLAGIRGFLYIRGMLRTQKKFYNGRKPNGKRLARPVISLDTRHLILGAQCVERDGRAFVVDSYYGLGRPLLPPFDIGLEVYDGVKYFDVELDHIWPYSKKGNDEIGNYQALAHQTNTFGYTTEEGRFPQHSGKAEAGKGNRILLHSQYIGLLCGEDVEARDFGSGWRDFLKEFDSTGRMVKYWPFWLRESTPPRRPIAPGWDGVKLDKRAAFLGDWQRRANFARIYLKHARPDMAMRYKVLWRAQVGFML
ncbi:MAG: hypothetical protein ACRD5H_00910 [Nitrososphaerales archaeon]